MNYKIIYFLLIIALPLSAQIKTDSLIDLSQIKNSKPKLLLENQIASNKLSAELIIYQDEELISHIKKLEYYDNCLRQGEVWYLNIYDNYISLSKTYIQNLLASLNEDKKLYITIVNDQVIFILTRNVTSNIIRTSLYIDLIRYAELDYSFGDESVIWYIVRKNKQYDTIIKKIRCE